MILEDMGKSYHAIFFYFIHLVMINICQTSKCGNILLVYALGFRTKCLLTYNCVISRACVL